MPGSGSAHEKKNGAEKEEEGDKCKDDYAEEREHSHVLVHGSLYACASGTVLRARCAQCISTHLSTACWSALACCFNGSS